MSFGNGDAKACVLERFHGGDPDLRVEVIRERVGPEDHLAAARVMRPAARVPRLQRERSERRQVPLGMDVRSELRHRCKRLALRHEVREPGRLRREARNLVDEPEGVRLPRPEPTLVVVREELRLQRRHVDVDGAIVRAALAG